MSKQDFLKSFFSLLLNAKDVKYSYSGSKTDAFSIGFLQQIYYNTPVASSLFMYPTYEDLEDSLTLISAKYDLEESSLNNVYLFIQDFIQYILSNRNLDYTTLIENMFQSKSFSFLNGNGELIMLSFE